MSAGGFKSWRSVLAFELAPSFKGPLLWAALVGLLLIEVPIWVVSNGQIDISGQLIGKTERLVGVQWFVHAYINVITTLLTMCLCLDRTGPHYLRNNDLLVLSRAVGRTSLYVAKITSVLVPSLLFSLVALGFFWVELLRQTGINHPAIFSHFLPLSIASTCLVALYFLMRNYMSNFVIFFLWLLVLPFIYALNGLLRYLAPEAWRDGIPRIFYLEFLPQFGGLHMHAMELVGATAGGLEAGFALYDCLAWAVAALVAGIWLFSRKRL